MSANVIAFAETQRRKTLTATTYTALVAAVLLGLFDIQFGTWVSVAASFGLAIACLPILYLISRGELRISSALLSVLVLIVITLNLFDGDGIRDPGIMVYPIFVMGGTLVLGKRAMPLLAFGAIASLAIIVYLDIAHVIHPTVGPTTYGVLIPLVALMLAASAIVWVIIDNNEKDLEQARASELELRDNYHQTLEAWAKILEYRHRETEGHSRRLVALSARLAHGLGLDPEQTEDLRRGALLHDIGKLAIPDEILLKPSSLDEDEVKVIQRHTVYAKEMLEGIPYLKPAVAVAYAHHERWDGQGYPDGLRGAEIPFLARVFAVVDSWDALRSERPYRPAWSAAETIAYLKQNAGVRYDPRVVEVFLGLI